MCGSFVFEVLYCVLVMCFVSVLMLVIIVSLFCEYSECRFVMFGCRLSNILELVSDRIWFCGSVSLLGFVVLL